MNMSGKTIGVVKKSSGEASSFEWTNTVTLDDVSAVKMPFGPMDVQSYGADGFNLIIKLNSGAAITVEKFFAKFDEDNKGSELILEDAEGISWLGQFDQTVSEFTFTEIAALDADASIAAGVLADIPDWALIGLSVLAVGGVAIAASSGGGGGSSSSNNDALPAEPAARNDLQANEGATNDEFNSVISTAGNEIYELDEGSARVLFTNLGLDELGGNGGNGIDTLIDFSEADGDTIDISALLDGNQTADNLSQYLEYKDGKLRVDRKGESNFEDLLIVDADGLAELIPSIVWQVPALAKSYFETVEFSMSDTGEGFDLSSLENLDEFSLFDTESIENELVLEEMLSQETDSEQFVLFAEGDVEVTQEFINAESNEVTLDVMPTVDFLDDLLSQSYL